MDINVLILLLNIGVVLFYVFMFFRGYKKGFALQLLNLLGLIFAIYVAWLISPAFAKVFPIIPASSLPLEGTVIAEYLQQYLNKIVWMIILVILIKIGLIFVRPIVKVVQNLPIIKQLNGVLGALFSLITSTLWILVFAIVLSLPIIKMNGKEIGTKLVEKGLIGLIQKGTSQLVSVLEEPIMNNKELQNLFENFDELNDQELKNIENWLKSVK